MPFGRPSVAELNTQSQGDVASRITGATPAVRRSIIGAVMTACAGAFSSMYGFLVERAKQSVPYSATNLADLQGWGRILKLPQKLPTFAFGPIALTGTPLQEIPADQAMQSPLGVEYNLRASVTLDGTGNGVGIIDALDAGADGNLSAGTVISFINPVGGIDADCTVGSDGITGGADLETWQAYKARIIQRFQNPPHGGNDADYESWALSVGPITRVWVRKLYSGRGTVRVFVANDKYVGANLAAAGDVALCQTYIDSVKPNGASLLDGGGHVISGVTVVAPAKVPQDFALTISPDNDSNRSAVKAALATMYFNRAIPEGTVKLHWMERAIENAGTVDDYGMTSPVTDTVAGANQIGSLGNVVFS